MLLQLINEINEAQADHVPEYPFHIKWNIPADLSLISFPRSMVQVFFILIENAELHAFEGRNNGRLTIQASLQRDHVLIGSVTTELE